MKSGNNVTIRPNKTHAQLQAAEQQSEIGIVVPKTLVMLLTKPMCENILSLSKNACVVTEDAWRSLLNRVSCHAVQP